MAACKRMLALLEVPRYRRCAIGFIESVVSRRSRAATTSLTGSLLRRDSKSASLQLSRRNSSARMRSALAWAVSSRSCPEWCSPTLPSASKAANHHSWL